MIDALVKETEEYLEQSASWEAKWGNWLIVDEELRPKNMDKKPEPSHPYLLWRQCKDYGSMLVSGGVLDQPYWSWTCVNAVGAAVSNHEWKASKRDEINRKNKNE